MWRTIGILLGLVFLLSQGPLPSGLAEEATWIERRGMLGLMEAAERTRQAAAKNDAAALRELTLLQNVDAWIIAEQLLGSGDSEAALKLAKAREGRELEKLAAYVKARAGDERGSAEFARFLTLLAPGNAKGRAALLEEPASEQPIKTVGGILLADVRAREHARLRQRDAQVAWCKKAIAASEALGWHLQAQRLLPPLGRAQERMRALDEAGKTWTRYLQAARALGDRKSVANGHFRFGWYYLDQLKWAKARASFHASREHEEALGSEADVAACWINIGHAYRNEGQAKKAIAPLRKGLEIAERIGHARWRWNALDNLRGVHALLSEHAKALEIAKSQLAEAEGRDDAHALARNHASVAEALEGLHKYDDALRHHKLARENLERAGDKGHAAFTSIQIGKVYRLLRRMDEAVAIQTKAVQEAEALGHESTVIDGLIELARTFHDARRFEEAREHGTRAIERAQAHENVPREVRALITMMVIDTSGADYAAAVEKGLRARKLAQRIRARRLFGSASRSLAEAYAAQGDPRRAVPLLERSIAEMEGTGARRAAERHRRILADVHFQMGNHAEGLRLYAQAKDWLTKLGFQKDAADLLHARGSLASRLGKVGDALAAYEQARDAYAALGDRYSVGTCLVRIGALRAQNGETEEARPLFKEALSIAEEFGSRASVAEALVLLATMEVEDGNFDAALAANERILELEQALGRQHQVAWTYEAIGWIHLRSGKPEKAIPLFEQALEIADARRLHKLAVHGRARLAGAYIETKQFELALKVAKRALVEAEVLLSGLAEEEGATMREGLQYLYASGAAAAQAMDRPEDVVAFLEAGRAGSLLDALDKRDALRWKQESLSPELKAMDRDARQAALQARRAHDRAVRRGRLAERRKTGEALDRAQQAVQEVAARIQRDLKLRAGFFYPRPRRLEEIQASLDDGQALVLYANVRSTTLAIVVRPDDARVVDLGPHAAIEAACAALEPEDTDADPAKTLAAIRTLIVEPLKLTKDVEQILVSPYASLTLLPYGALFEKPVAVTPSGTTHVLLSSEMDDPGEGILALGAPSYDGTSEGARALYYGGRPLAALPATRKEVDAIGTVKLLGDKASEAELRKAVGTRERWRAVHLACHGLVDVDRPLLSSLALTPSGADDGFLTGHEVFRMELPTDLVVLSACETARGRLVGGEGIVGLTRAFMFAGSARVICSLWKVPDDATAALMIKFYELWNPKDGSEGLSAAEALKKAQEHIKAQPKWKHPYYWGAWVLWGLPQ